MLRSILLWPNHERSRRRESKSPSRQKKVVEIVGRKDLFFSVAVLDEKHIVNGGKEGKIRRWRTEDGAEVGKPMDVGRPIRVLAASHEGTRIVCGTEDGWVSVWHAESHQMALEFQGHADLVCAVDVSPDGTRFATGAYDHVACVWSLSTGERLLGPWGHDQEVNAVKFSPNGLYVATGTGDHDALRVYDSRSGRTLVDVPVRVHSAYNQGLAWTRDGEQVLVSTYKRVIYSVDVATGTVTRLVDGAYADNCITVARNGTFVAASLGSAVSFWNTATYEQIRSVVHHSGTVDYMAMTARYDLVTGGARSVTIRNLRDILPSSYFDDPTQSERNTDQETDSISQSVYMHLDGTAEDVQSEPETSSTGRRTRHNEIVEGLSRENGDLRARAEHLSGRIALLEENNKELRLQLAGAQRVVYAHEQRYQCESLYAQGRMLDAAGILLEMVTTASEDVTASASLSDWLSEFTQRCIVILQGVGDEASNAGKQDDALTAYSTALDLSSSTPETVLTKWAKMMLSRGSAQEALSAAIKFKASRFVVYRVICDILEGDDRRTEAAECFRQMQGELPAEIGARDGRRQWELDFRARCIEKLVISGDHSNPPLYPSSLDENLKRIDEAIELNPSYHQGYERKHVALHNMGRYKEAFGAFRLMLSKIEGSPDPKIHELRQQYIDPTSAIQKVVEKTIRHMPRVLIDTITGCLYDKKQQAAAFEELPIYDELRSSMTTLALLDYARIRSEVKKFYRYVMLSHRWQPNEPTFQQLEKGSIYKLPLSPTTRKLQNFCKLACTLDFKWAWTDTCCVNQHDKGVQQESLVAMFRWYRGSSLTIVHLLGVFSESHGIGCLWNSIWNTRGWTYQEYVASEVVQFYTEDWKPYLGLNAFNHKESPIILQEMERAMNFTTQQLATIQPGLDRAREKLYLASARHTTREEDIAYSLFGVFNVAIPVIYGEGDRAVGRLLEHILTGSGDVSVLAWTGRAGSFNSCLPVDLRVYNRLVPPHIPQPIEPSKMDDMVEKLRSSLSNVFRAKTLRDELEKLPLPSVAASRLQLSGLMFPVASLVPAAESAADSDHHTYRTTTAALGIVEISTTDDLSGMEGCVFIHPWISPLLDQDFSHRPADLSAVTHALRLVARLRQPFGALLLRPLSRSLYRRVATDTLIMVQVREETLLDDLMDGIGTVDIQ